MIPMSDDSSFVNRVHYEICFLKAPSSGTFKSHIILKVALAIILHFLNEMKSFRFSYDLIILQKMSLLSVYCFDKSRAMYLVVKQRNNNIKCLAHVKTQLARVLQQLP